MLGLTTSLSIGSNDSVEKERIVERSIGIIGGEQKARGVVNGVEIGGCGREFGED